MTAPIEAEGLRRTFGDVVAVDEVDLTVSTGEIFGFLGPNGAGKTTTLRMLAGVLRPTDGDAVVGGVSVADDPEGVKRHIAYMSQRFGLYGDLTVAENLGFYADLYRVPRGERPARLERLYAFSGLEPFRDRLAGQLSGGMKQKLGLSCALIHEPRVLLLDEPGAGVPKDESDAIFDIVAALPQDVAILIIEHDMDVVQEISDWIVVLAEGAVIAEGTPGDIATNDRVIEAYLGAEFRGRAS